MTTLVRLEVSPKRMLNIGEAAHYCGLPVHHFRNRCPVKPVRIDDGHAAYHIKDIDEWIDALKAGERE
jgi:predicted DNA-binding transcriptional regulator AlpA